VAHWVSSVVSWNSPHLCRWDSSDCH